MQICFVYFFISVQPLSTYFGYNSPNFIIWATVNLASVGNADIFRGVKKLLRRQVDLTKAGSRQVDIFFILGKKNDAQATVLGTELINQL